VDDQVWAHYKGHRVKQRVMVRAEGESVPDVVAASSLENGHNMGGFHDLELNGTQPQA